jgi:hypothetical protein
VYIELLWFYQWEHLFLEFAKNMVRKVFKFPLWLIFFLK